MSKINNQIINKTIETVAKFYNVSYGDIISKSRLEPLIKPRFIVIYILREKFHGSFPVISKKIGGREHTSAIYSYKRIRDEIQKDPLLGNEIDDIYAIIGGQKEYIEKYIDRTIKKVIKKKTKTKKISAILSDREKYILTGWQSGRTLEDIGYEHNITRERVRQIVVKAISREIAGKQLEGFEINTSEFLKQEKNNHATLRRNKLTPIVNEDKTIKNTKRWSRYYDRCRKCGTTIVPHLASGFCAECSPRGVRDKRRISLILDTGNKCSSCGLDRSESFRKFGRDLYVTTEKITQKYTVMCRECFLEYASKKMVEGRKNSREKNEN